MKRRRCEQYTNCGGPLSDPLATCGKAATHKSVLRYSFVEGRRYDGIVLCPHHAVERRRACLDRFGMVVSVSVYRFRWIR